MKKFALVILMGCLAMAGFSQNQPKGITKKERREAKRERINALIKMEEEGELVFRKHSIFGFKANSDGYGLSYEIGRFKSNRLTNIYQLELNEKKHRQEKKINTINNGFEFNSTIPFKMNNFYQVKLGLGQQRIIGGKGNKNGVAVAVIYAGGLSLGLVKPYLIDVESNGKRFRSEFPTIWDSGYAIIGAAGFTTGWSELSVKPGAHAKAAMRFDYGRFNETVTAIEAGINVEFYSAKIPQVMFAKQDQFFFNAYVSILLGRRKN